MTFHYLGQTRLSLWFDSPNHCATIVAMLLLAIISTTTAFGPRTQFKKWSILLFSMLITGLSLILILTYSRGGWVAYAAGLLFLALYIPRLRKLCVFCVFGFIVGVAIIPEGLDRAESLADQEDASITNRIEVWKGAMAMTADHPFFGVGIGQFGTQFCAWYQPRTMNTYYEAALNNYLTISSERGIPVLFLYLAFLLMPLWIASVFAKKDQNVIILGACAGIVVYAVSALFTSSLRFWHVSLFAGCLWSVLFVYIIKKWHQNRHSFDLKSVLLPVLFSLILSAFVLGMGSCLLTALPIRVTLFTFNGTQLNQNAAILYPQHQPSIGVILYFHGDGQSIVDTAKNTLRPMAEAGFTVISVDYRLRERDGLNDISTLLEWATMQPELKGAPLYLCGLGKGGQLSILAACRTNSPHLKALAVIDAHTDWPFPDLSPLRQIQHLTVPLLLLQDENDPLVGIEESRTFLQDGSHQGKEIYLTILKPGISEHEYMKQLLHFLAMHK